MTVQRILLGMALLGGVTPFVGTAHAQGVDEITGDPIPSRPRPLSPGTGVTNTPTPLMGSPTSGTAQPLATLTGAPSATMKRAGT